MLLDVQHNQVLETELARHYDNTLSVHIHTTLDLALINELYEVYMF